MLRCIKIFLSICLLTAIPAGSFAQNWQLGDFLAAEGPIPKDFLEPWSLKFKKSLAESGDMAGKKVDLEYFWLEQHHAIDALLQSGKYSFGDPLTLYLNEIADHLLQNNIELREKIRIYTYRSPTVNAFTLADGIIAINVGLIAHVQSEAELAIVIAHEIAHYEKRHHYQRFQSILKDQESGGLFSGYSRLAKAERFISRSKNQEIEADQYGVDLYLQSDYALDGVGNMLTTLHQSYIPFGRSPVNGNPFCIPDYCFQIPNVFFRNEINPITKSEDYFDARHTHPNIGNRRRAIDASLVQVPLQGSKKLFVVGESRFHEVQNIARFEMVREKVLNGSYAEVLYDIYVLEQQNPGNKFLEISKVKALYGLATFKVLDLISYVTPSTSDLEGPSQQVAHLVKQFNRSQMVTIALQTSLATQLKYPSNPHLKRYSSELSKYLFVYCKEDPESFSFDGSGLPSFSKNAGDFNSERAYLRAQQKHYKEFYQYLLQGLTRQDWLQTEGIKHQSFNDSLSQELRLTVEQKEEREEREQEKLEEEGSNLEVRNITFLNPSINIYNASDDARDLLDGLKQEQDFLDNLQKWNVEQGLNAEYLYLESLDRLNVDAYNQYAMLEEWMTEVSNFGALAKMPVSIDFSDQLPRSNKFICRIIGSIDEEGDNVYYFGLFNLNSGKAVYLQEQDAGRRLSSKDLKVETKNDLRIIYN